MSVCVCVGLFLPASGDCFVKLLVASQEAALQILNPQKFLLQRKRASIKPYGGSCRYLFNEQQTCMVCTGNSQLLFNVMKKSN